MTELNLTLFLANRAGRVDGAAVNRRQPNDTMKTTAKKLTAAQSSLADLVTKNPGLNTHRLAVLRGDLQAYESQLKNRLRWLEKQGIVKSAKVGRETQWSAA
jgi:hypothetical protein